MKLLIHNICIISRQCTSIDSYGDTFTYVELGVVVWSANHEHGEENQSVHICSQDNFDLLLHVISLYFYDSTVDSFSTKHVPHKDGRWTDDDTFSFSLFYSLLALRLVL